MAVNSVTGQRNTIDLPDEIICNILFQSSTPTFLQLTRTSKQFYNCAKDDRELLLHHLRQIPGAKTDLSDKARDNLALFQLLRQRAANNLYGINFTANVTEYVARYTKLNIGASCISGLDADYVRHALCFENSVDIRQYTSNCLVKEKISQRPDTKNLKTVQWGRYLSVLCAYPNNEEAEEFPEEEGSDHYESDSGSESEAEMEAGVVERAPFDPTVNALLDSRITPISGTRTPGRRKPPSKVKGYKYRICHYDIYTLEESSTFIVDDQPGLVPRDFIVQNPTFCAVLWDKNTGDGRPTNKAKVIVYIAREAQTYYAPKYDAHIMWPKRSKPSRATSNHSDDEDESTESPPEKIAFFRDGRRIKMYSAGGIVPYKVFSSFPDDDERSYISSNVVHYGGNYSIDLYIDTPFYGMHGKYYENLAQQDYCYQTYLCLGISKLNFGEYDGNPREANVLCILRSQTKKESEDCDCKISLQRMAHLSAQSSSIVARLWGWEEMHTNLTGKEAVAVSSGGTRIAIAMWDKVLIYAINPRILCEETVVDSSEDETEKSKKKKRKAKKTWEYPATEYYHRIKDSNLLDMNVAQLRPVVIDLDGAIAHRMNWSPARGKITDTVPTIEEEESIPEPEVEENIIQTEQSSISSNSDTGSETITPDSDISALQMHGEVIGSVDEPTSTLEGEVELATSTQLDANCTKDEQTEHLTAVENSPISNQSTIEHNLCQGLASVKLEPQSSTPDNSPNCTSPNASDQDKSNTSVPGLPFSDISTNTGSLPPSSLPVTGSASQAVKTSARKKEKLPELISDNLSLTSSMKEKTFSGYTVVDQPKQKNAALVSIPSSPIMSKTCPKPKQTVAEALEANNTSSLVPIDAPETGTKALSIAPSVNSCCYDTSPIADDETACTVGKSETVSTEPTAEHGDHSKFAMSANVTQGEPPACGSQAGVEPEKDVQPKRRKRVTEDELIILTDRGIQIWNLGPRAKGIRPRPRGLPMEEGLAGKVPLSK